MYENSSLSRGVAASSAVTGGGGYRQRPSYLRDAVYTYTGDITGQRVQSRILDRFSKARSIAYVPSRSRASNCAQDPGFLVSKQEACVLAGFTTLASKSAENTDKAEVDLSPPNPPEHRTLFAQGCTKLWSWRWGRKQALEGGWM